MIKMSILPLLGFLLFHIQGAADMQILLNTWEILVKEFFFFNKILVLQPANAIKIKFLPNNFQAFLSAF